MVITADEALALLRAWVRAWNRAEHMVSPRGDLVVAFLPEDVDELNAATDLKIDAEEDGTHELTEQNPTTEPEAPVDVSAITLVKCGND